MNAEQLREAAALQERLDAIEGTEFELEQFRVKHGVDEVVEANVMHDERGVHPDIPIPLSRWQQFITQVKEETINRLQALGVEL